MNCKAGYVLVNDKCRSNKTQDEDLPDEVVEEPIATCPKGFQLDNGKCIFLYLKHYENL